jgi:ketosteroid isomerase-like protein
MSRKLIVTLFQHIDSQDWRALHDIFAPDIVYERPGYPPFVGLDRVMRFYTDERLIAAGRHTIERIVIDGNHAVCLGNILGVTKDGREIVEQFADSYTFQGDRIHSRRSYFFTPCI